jgi:TetR/AcrR family transcriptional regulator, mexJK operon transcriptional repressor
MTKQPSSTADGVVCDAHSGKVGQILDAARHLFLEQGYSNTSMDSVAKRACVSKATLYAHFDSKERLFSDVVAAARSSLNESLAAITRNDDLEPAETLRLIGRQFLRFVTAPGPLALFRVVIGETQRFPELGQNVFQTGSNQILDIFTACIARAAARGLLDVPDPQAAAGQFIGLTKSDLHLRCLLEPLYLASDADIERNVNAAVAVFMSHYGPRQR